MVKTIKWSYPFRLEYAQETPISCFNPNITVQLEKFSIQEGEIFKFKGPHASCCSILVLPYPKLFFYSLNMTLFCFSVLLLSRTQVPWNHYRPSIYLGHQCLVSWLNDGRDSCQLSFSVEKWKLCGGQYSCWFISTLFSCSNIIFTWTSLKR